MLKRHLANFLTIRGALVVFCAVVVVLAWVSYRQFAQSYRAEAHARLSAIAEMKAGEVADWRRERLADGLPFLAKPYSPSALASAVRAVLDRA